MLLALFSLQDDQYGTGFGKYKEKSPTCTVFCLFCPSPMLTVYITLNSQEPQLLQEMCSGESQKSLRLALRLQR